MMLFGTISEGPIYVVTKLDKEIMEKMLIFRQIQSLAWETKEYTEYVRADSMFKF